MVNLELQPRRARSAWEGAAEGGTGGLAERHLPVHAVRARIAVDLGQVAARDR